MKCLFISDLHGDCEKFQNLFDTIKKEKPDGVFIGGDVLPNQFSIKESLDLYLEKEFFSKIKKFKGKTRFFVIMGNDDPKAFEGFFVEAEKEGLIDYVNSKTVSFNDLFVTGYSYVPPTPFLLKDWEKYDVSRFVDVGVVSPEEGKRTVEVSPDYARYSTISEDLEKLSKNAPVEKTVFLFHSPPYKSNLDKADLEGKMIDHAPVDPHVGSIAIKRFIEKRQPLLTLHGHVHETVSLTGEWKDLFGKTFSFSASHEDKELAIIIFDTKNLKKAKRKLIKL